jgi:hypothetical protein
MKFLLTCRPAPQPPVDPAQAVGLIEAATAWTEAHLASGVLECSYLFPDRGGIAIVEAASPEDLMDILLGYPAYPLYSWAVQPLVDWRTGLARVLSHLRDAAGRPADRPANR